MKKIVLFMVIFVSTIIGNASHELTHYVDQKIRNDDFKLNSMCFLGISGDSVGWVEYTTRDLETRSKLEYEWLPYTIGSIVSLVFVFFLIRTINQ